MIRLAVMRWRPADSCDLETTRDIHLDGERPYTEFTDERENGPSRILQSILRFTVTVGVFEPETV
jgi:hypothetical protein